METLVDQSQFQGTCYKAANWVHVGNDRPGADGPAKQT